MMKTIYVQYISPKRGKQTPVLFDTAKTTKEADKLLALAKTQYNKNHRVFIGEKCSRCKIPFANKDLTQGFCVGCIKDMAELDKEEPDGGAYREHQCPY